jgi:hypothetical protein
MVARPLLTERDPETETPSVETVAMEADAGFADTPGWFPGSGSGGGALTCANPWQAQLKQAVARIRAILLL